LDVQRRRGTIVKIGTISTVAVVASRAEAQRQANLSISHVQRIARRLTVVQLVIPSPVDRLRPARGRASAAEGSHAAGSGSMRSLAAGCRPGRMSTAAWD